MAKRRATTAAEYLPELPPDRRTTARRIRRLAAERLADATDSIQYGMILVGRPDGVGVAIANQVRYVSVYGPGDLFREFAPRLRGLDRGKRCLRFRPNRDIDSELLREWFRALARTVPTLPVSHRAAG